MWHPDHEIEPIEALPIVVGAHLQAELSDRPIAYQLRDAITSWTDQHDIDGPPCPIVCTDMWYLNQTALRTQPTICLGRPEINAASAALSTKLETIALIEDLYRIQADPEYIDLKCCLWGIDDKCTRQCVDSFITEVLPHFLGSIFGIGVEI